jgi:hypothetical protein
MGHAVGEHNHPHPGGGISSRHNHPHED